MEYIITKTITLQQVCMLLLCVVAQVLAHLAPNLHAQPTPTPPQEFTASIRMPREVSIGDTVRAAIVLRALTPAARQLTITSVEFLFRFNPSVVYLLDTNLSRAAYYGGNNMEVSIARPVNRSLQAQEDTLLQIPLLITWGDTEFSELKGGGEFKINVVDAVNFRSVPLESHLFRIRDVAWGDSLLTLNQLGSPLSMTLGPNPATNVLNFQLSIGNLPTQPLAVPTLSLYFLQGPFAGSEAISFRDDLTPLFRSRRTEMLRGELRFPNNGPRLPRGLYLCRFAYATYAVSRLVFVQ